VLILDQLSWSWRHSRRHLFESILIILAIALGVGVIVTVFSLFFATNTQFQQITEQDYMRTLQVLDKTDVIGRGGAPIVLLGTELPTSRWYSTLSEVEELQRSLPETMHVFVETRWSGTTALLEGAELPEELAMFPWLSAEEVSFAGTLPAYFAFKGLELVKGSLFLPEDIENGSRVAVLPARLAQSLFGDEDPIGREIPLDLRNDSVIFTVIGVVEPTREEPLGSFLAFEEGRSVYAPVTASPYEDSDNFYQVSIGVDPDVDLFLAKERVEEEARLIWGDSAAVQSPLEDYVESQRLLRRYAVIVGVFASLGLVIAVINILNLMLARVLKRTKAVGLSIALGSSRGMVFRQFMGEASLLGIIGALLGVGVSYGLSALLKAALGGNMDAMTGIRLLLGAGLGVLISLLFGVYPAFLASKIDPADALRTD